MGEVIALIGMGLLGSALAETLIAAGFTVRGYDVAPDRRREHAARGGIAARSSADAARGASVVVTCLMTADLVREVLLGPDGALETAAPGTVVIDAGTIHPDASAALARDLAARGIAMLDAPVGGSSGQARRREAPVVVGGEPAIFDWPWPRDSCSGSARGWTARPCSPSSRTAGPTRARWISRASACSRAISSRRASSPSISRTSS